MTFAQGRTAFRRNIELIRMKSNNDLILLNFNSNIAPCNGLYIVIYPSQIRRSWFHSREVVEAISVNSPLKKAPLTGFHPTAKPNAAKAPFSTGCYAETAAAYIQIAMIKLMTRRLARFSYY
jgi:hypothetical protein